MVVTPATLSVEHTTYVFGKFLTYTAICAGSLSSVSYFVLISKQTGEASAG